MKPLLSLLLSLTLCLSFLTGCKNAALAPGSSGESDHSDVSLSDTSSEESEQEPDAFEFTPDASISEPSTEPEGASEFSVNAIEAFEGSYLFQASESGIYTFACINEDGYEEANWTVVVLEEAFEDATRFLPQAMTSDTPPAGLMLEIHPDAALSVPVEAGNYIYCISSLNAWTVGEPLENASELKITMEAN